MDQPAIDYYGLPPSPLRLGPGWHGTFPIAPPLPLASMPEPALYQGSRAPLPSRVVDWLARLGGFSRP
jgi:hypothetical protein